MRGKKRLKFRQHFGGVAISLCWLMLASGCARVHNADQPTAEHQVLQNVTQLTFDYERAGEGYFSRDMNWVIFQAVPPGQDGNASTKPAQKYQMYVAPLRWTTREATDEHGAVLRERVINGIGKPIRISPDKSRNTCGYFSPDGNSIIFASTAGKDDPDEPPAGYQREGGNYRWAFSAGMDLFRADGWQGAISAIEPGRQVNLAQHRMTDNSSYDAEGAVSADGKWIVFTSNRDGDLELYAMRPDGSDAVRLTKQPGYDGGAFFSPDGKRLVYSDRKSNNLLQIFVADVAYDRDGRITGISRERQLTNDTNVNWGPFWHPNGRHIVYATSVHGHVNYELYMMRADGTRKSRLTFAPGADVLPAFSPDGKYLMWSSKRSEDNTTQLFLAEFRMPKGM